MTIAEQCWKRLEGVRDFRTFRDYLIDTLSWELDPDVRKMEETAFEYTHEELNSPLLDDKCDGRALQLRFLEDLPWGVFLLDFRCEDPFTKSRGFTTVLRQILNALVPKQRKDPSMKSWNRENLLFICTHDYKHFRFAYFKAPKGKEKVSPLAIFGWNQGDTALRTLCEHNLPLLEWEKMEHWPGAFDVEAVTKKFFGEYRKVFESVEKRIDGVPKGEARRLFTQRLFNRLMFIQFIQKKGWLSIEDKRDYLRALWVNYDSETKSAQKISSFYEQRLKPLFFLALNTPHEQNLIGINRGGFLGELVGNVPYLNGGLFQKEEHDDDPSVVIPDSVFSNTTGEAIFDLFDKYNFTITESTPLNIEVAVDPEMLGKVFEELVTGRHESGSYYTPRPVVSFMCRESLKAYLTTQLPKEKPEAIERFVEHHEPGGLSYPEKVLEALRGVKVCDPACGSGAYLLGMLHELFDLGHCLFAVHKLDAKTDYERKLNIIQNNLYGVDIDPFAVNIAMLRLWLSLAVEYEGDNPPPLPNLDFKIEIGDSLTAHSHKGMELWENKYKEMAKELEELTSIHTNSGRLRSSGVDKRSQGKRIEEQRDRIADLLHAREEKGTFDWWVKFAHVFAEGGFDVVIGNPPYAGFQQISQEYKDRVSEQYSCAKGRYDKYMLFIERGLTILSSEGSLLFICPSTFLKRAGGKALRKMIRENYGIRSILDFGHEQVFIGVLNYTCIAHFTKHKRSSLRIDSGKPKQEGIVADSYSISAKQLPSDDGLWFFPQGVAAKIWTDLSKERLVALGRIAEISEGIVTGKNDVFLVKKEKAVHLGIEEQLLSPCLRGSEVHPFWIDPPFESVIYPYDHENGQVIEEEVLMNRFPSAHAYLSQFKKVLLSRSYFRKSGKEWYELWNQRRPDNIFRRKIVVSELADRNSFAISSENVVYGDTVCGIFPHDDKLPLSVLVAILNSSLVQIYYAQLTVPKANGFFIYKPLYLKNIPLPFPDLLASPDLEQLAEKAQGLHGKRRARAEQFLLDLGIPPSESKSRNPLEQPWDLTPDVFHKKAKGYSDKLYAEARDETMSLTEQIEAVEREIDERVKALYGL